MAPNLTMAVMIYQIGQTLTARPCLCWSLLIASHQGPEYWAIMLFVQTNVFPITILMYISLLIEEVTMIDCVLPIINSWFLCKVSICLRCLRVRLPAAAAGPGPGRLPGVWGPEPQAAAEQWPGPGDPGRQAGARCSLRSAQRNQIRQSDLTNLLINCS